MIGTVHPLAPRVVLFYGHHPRADRLHLLSQWAPTVFTVGQHTYRTAEHYMMAEKVALFGDEACRRRILSCPGPAEAKRLGRMVQGFDDRLWQHRRAGIVFRGSLAKADQNSAVRDVLVQSGSAILAEASPKDRIWGIGLSADHPDAHTPTRWPGLNLLGQALMRAREVLKERAGDKGGEESRTEVLSFIAAKRLLSERGPRHAERACLEQDDRSR